MTIASAGIQRNPLTPLAAPMGQKCRDDAPGVRQRCFCNKVICNATAAIKGVSMLGDRISATSGLYGGARRSGGRNRGLVGR